jgi:hypothetical protein
MARLLNCHLPHNVVDIDIINHFVCARYTNYKNCLRRMIKMNIPSGISRNEKAPSCPKCRGFMEYTDSSSDLDGIRAKILRCVNCGKILFTNIYNKLTV